MKKDLKVGPLTVAESLDQSAASTPSSDFDAKRYWHLVEGFDAPDSHKIELIRAVWRVSQAFVDRCFGLDSALLALRERKVETSVPDRVPVVDLKHSNLSDRFRESGRAEQQNQEPVRGSEWPTSRPALLSIAV